MFCGQGQSIIFTFSNASFYLNYSHRGLHLTFGPVNDEQILKTFFKVKDHGKTDFKIIIGHICLSFFKKPGF